MATGRYDGVAHAELELTGATGQRRTVRYLRRRRLPELREVLPVAWHRVVAADRLDLIAARHLGDPLAAWQIADANLALDPEELTAPGTEGDLLMIPFPRAGP